MHSRGDEDLNTLGVWFFSKEKIWQHWGLWREQAPFSLTQEFELQYQSYLSSEMGLELSFTTAVGKITVLSCERMFLIWSAFFLIEKRKTQEREILTWSPSRDIEAFNHGACLRPLLKLYQLERWILQTQGVRGLCHLVIGISWSQPGLDLMLLHSVDPDTQHCGFFGFWWMICSRMALSFIRDTLKGLQLQYVVWRNCNSEVPGSVLLRRLKILF